MFCDSNVPSMSKSSDGFPGIQAQSVHTACCDIEEQLCKSKLEISDLQSELRLLQALVAALREGRDCEVVRVPPVAL
jgi:hypothetical protein